MMRTSRMIAAGSDASLTANRICVGTEARPMSEIYVTLGITNVSRKMTIDADAHEQQGWGR